MTLYEITAFARVFVPGEVGFNNNSSLVHPAFSAVEAELLGKLGGRHFGGGTYRLYNQAESKHWGRALSDAFPIKNRKLVCFGRNWLCNQFALDLDRIEDGVPQVCLFEIGTGDEMELPVGFGDLHKTLMIEEPDAVLAAPFFGEWVSANGSLKLNECVGYKIPLFLGGDDDVPNLERSDADVYWSLSAQLLKQAS